MAAHKMAWNPAYGGYHVYKDLWDTLIGEDILCEREPFNQSFQLFNLK